MYKDMYTRTYRKRVYRSRCGCVGVHHISNNEVGTCYREHATDLVRT